MFPKTLPNHPWWSPYLWYWCIPVAGMMRQLPVVDSCSCVSSWSGVMAPSWRQLELVHGPVVDGVARVTCGGGHVPRWHVSLPHVYPRIIEWGHGCRPGRINIILCSNNLKQVFIHYLESASYLAWHCCPSDPALEWRDLSVSWTTTPLLQAATATPATVSWPPPTYWPPPAPPGYWTSVSPMSIVLGWGENGLFRLFRAIGEYGAVAAEYCLSSVASLPEHVNHIKIHRENKPIIPE